MAQEKVWVTVIQVQRAGDGSLLFAGDDPYYVHESGDYDKTIAALKDADFKPVDRIEDAIDRADE